MRTKSKIDIALALLGVLMVVSIFYFFWHHAVLIGAGKVGDGFFCEQMKQGTGRPFGEMKKSNHVTTWKIFLQFPLFENRDLPEKMVDKTLYVFSDVHDLDDFSKLELVSMKDYMATMGAQIIVVKNDKPIAKAELFIDHPNKVAGIQTRACGFLRFKNYESWLVNLKNFRRVHLYATPKRSFLSLIRGYGP